MDKSELTTIQISKETLRQLRELAIKDRRTNPSELTWLIEQELILRSASITHGPRSDQ